MTIMLSQLGGKEIINLNNGERLGIIADTDIVVDKNWEDTKIISSRKKTSV